MARHGRSITFGHRGFHYGLGVYLEGVLRFPAEQLEPPFEFFVGIGLDGDTFTGRGFGFNQGAGILEFSDSPIYGAGNIVEQPTFSGFWNDTAILIVDPGVTIGGGLTVGWPRWAWVTTDDGDHNTEGLEIRIVTPKLAVTLHQVSQEIF